MIYFNELTPEQKRTLQDARANQPIMINPDIQFTALDMVRCNNLMINKPSRWRRATVDRDTRAMKRMVTWFSGDINEKTADCLAALYRRTTEDELLRLSGGNKWICRRAIELYKRNLVICGYES